MALNIIITSTTAPPGYVYIWRKVYFTATSHWTTWTYGVRVYINGNIWSNVSWAMGWDPVSPSQRVTVKGLTQGLTYTVQIAGNKTGNWEYSNIYTFTMPTLSPPPKAINPTPANEATEIDWSNKTISWQNGGGATSYDVYFGQSGSLISLGNQTGTSKIVPYTTEIIGETVHAYIDTTEIDWNIPFYWRIDAVNANGTTTGDIWWFDARPTKTINPIPENGYEKMPTNWMNFGWDEVSLATTYDVYFGTSLGSLAKIVDDGELITIAQNYLITVLGSFSGYNIVYFWRVNPKNEFGVAVGDIWWFATVHSTGFPYERRSDYDYDWTWDPVTGTWKDYTGTIAGGGRYKNQLVVVGHKCIYIGDV